jgi:hypothetical protein
VHGQHRDGGHPDRAELDGGRLDQLGGQHLDGAGALDQLGGQHLDGAGAWTGCPSRLVNVAA